MTHGRDESERIIHHGRGLVQALAIIAGLWALMEWLK